MFCLLKTAWPPTSAVLRSVIGGLGGRRFRPGEFDAILTQLEMPIGDPEETSKPMLLFTGHECREVGRFFSIAAEREATDEA